MIRRVAEMGEVVVEVQITNLFDAELALQGDLPFDKVRSVTCPAVVDTGAVLSVLPKSVVDALGIRIVRTVPVRLADDKTQQAGVVYGAVFKLLGREAVEEAYVLGTEVLIGQTVLEKLDLLVDCANQRVMGRLPEGPLHRV